MYHREIVRKSVNASSEDVVIFQSSGTTGAIHKLIHNLSLDKAPIVLVGPYEHHSNLLPWRHLAHRYSRLETDENGTVCLQSLKNTLERESPYAISEDRKLVVCIAAASNITGILSNVDQISALVHRYNGLVFWDYATAAPYVPIDMNPRVAGPDKDHVYKDAVYFSMHKFLGGPQTPGVLIAKKAIFASGETYPDCTGGGTVHFVNKENQKYSKDVETREEGGTPGIIESIRAGMVMQLRQSISPEYIFQKEQGIVRRAWNRLSSCQNLIVLGGSKAERLPVFSIIIRHKMLFVEEGKGSISENSNKAEKATQNVLFLHHNFVVAILNDLFGIQCRGGCACAGPYAMDLLGISDSLAKVYENVVIRVGLDLTTEVKDLLKPGFARFNLAYFSTEAEQEFVLNAICFVAAHGWKFLPFYQFDIHTGEWRHRDMTKNNDLKRLSDISYNTGVMSWRRPHTNSKGPVPDSYEACLKTAMKLAETAKSYVMQVGVNKIKDSLSNESFDHTMDRVRWFLLPSEAAAELCNEPIRNRPFSLPINIFSPFHPGTIERCFCPDLAYIEAENLIYRSNGVAFYNHERRAQDPSVHDWRVGGFKRPNSQLNETSSSYIAGDGDTMAFTSSALTNPLTSSISNSKLWCQPPKELFKPFLQAVRLFDMFRTGDRVLVCISGGKNSLGLLHCLRQYQLLEARGDPHNLPFSISAITVDPGIRRYNPRALIPYMHDLEIPYHYEEQDLLSNASANPSHCSEMKRRTIYAVAKRYDYNVIALAQNLDDIAARFIISIFHSGKIQTMEASVKINNSDVRVVRPLVFARENLITQFVETARLPIVTSPCPLCKEASREQDRIKRLLIDEEHLQPKLFESMSTAMIPLLRLSTPTNFNIVPLPPSEKKSSDKVLASGISNGKEYSRSPVRLKVLSPKVEPEREIARMSKPSGRNVLSNPIIQHKTPIEKRSTIFNHPMDP
ncbi:hypothetical protein Ciccas_012192, partial [Cichlidogyrus casuarinus]